MVLPVRVREALATTLPLVAPLLALSCGVREPERATLSLESPLHLEEHLAEARVEASGARLAVPDAIEWRFDEPQPDWRAPRHVDPLYGYPRRTTPRLDRLAAEGAVFEHAYSNSRWSKPSTTSLMTSLHNSVLGNTRDRFDPLPPRAVTMAEYFHRAGYQTAVFTSNPWAGSMSSLDRGVDVMRDAGAKRNAVSSVELHGDFWDWRAEYPGSPYWVHFQVTDVHDESGDADPPFAGLFLSPEQEKIWREWDARLEKEGDHGIASEAG